MSIQDNNYSLGRAARTTTTLGMAGLVLLGGAAIGAPAMAADAAPAGDVSAAVAGSHHHGHEVTLKAPHSATKGEKVPLKGKVKKTHHHKTRVTIQEKHGKKWKTLDHTKTSKKGTFHTSDVLKGKKTVTIRATAKGHGTSATQTVTLTKATNGNGTPGQSGPSGVTPGGGTGGGNVQPSGPQTQSITWDSNLGGDHAAGDSMTLKAHAQSGEAVTYTSSNTNAAQVSGNKLTFTGLGEASITAKAAGDANWKPASTAKKVKVDANVSVKDGKGLQTELDNAPQGKPKIIQLKGTDFTHAPQAGDISGQRAFIVRKKALVTLIGKGTLDGQNQVGVMEVEENANLTINGDITITGGSASTGGGIINEGAVTLNSGTISQNQAKGGGGGIANYGSSNAKVTLNGGSIENNQAANGGGIDNWGYGDEPAGVVTMLGGSISNNTADVGGGINSMGLVNLNGGEITDNEAHNWVGGVIIMPSYGGKLKVNSQEISKENLKLTEQYVYKNTADGGGANDVVLWT
jgi:hypothetical protein